MYINKIYNWNQQAVAKFMEKVRGNRVKFDPDRPHRYEWRSNRRS
jgi:hypothetical protein